MSVELAVIKLGRLSGGGFIDIVEVNGRWLVKPATTNIVVNLPDLISPGAAKFYSQL
ncbi:hypothetical protein QUA71_26335 [Microcoleus sp. MON1_C5]|uniref:hypothetical protein n=1 Tax=Microcoleus sp. MON1_C5 TaxID=2818828 RepID=UPI002FD2079B